MFVPMLIVGMVVIAGVVVFVPLVECNGCLGMGSWTVKEFNEIYAPEGNEPGDLSVAQLNEIMWSCRWCNGQGRISVSKRMFEEIPPDFDPFYSDSNYEAIREVQRNRSSTP